MMAVLIWQYARRREWPARILLAVALGIIPLCILFASSTLARRMAYPNSNARVSMMLAIRPGTDGVRRFEWGNGSEISIPVVGSGISDGQVFRVDGYRLHLAGSGWQWHSDWVNSARNLVSYYPQFKLQQFLPDWVHQRLARGHATATLQVAWENYRLKSPLKVQARGASFAVPGIGLCRARGQTLFMQYEFFSTAGCAAPLTLPAVYSIAIDGEGNQCTTTDGRPEVPPGHTAYALEFGSSVPAYFDPNPVRTFSLSVANWIPELPQASGEMEFRSASLCPGGIFVVRTGEYLGRQQRTFDLGDIGVSSDTTTEAPESKRHKFNPDYE